MNMKNLMILAALAATTVGVTAASVEWGFGADVYIATAVDGKASSELFGSAVLGSDYTEQIATGSYLALVYVGQGADSFSLSDIVREVDTMTFAVDNYSTWNPEMKTASISANEYSNGASFAVVWFNGESYDYLYDQTDGTAMTAAAKLDDVERGSLTIYQVDDSGAANYTGYLVNTVSVPEPGIACMALLGLGMLIKRRRA